MSIENPGDPFEDDPFASASSEEHAVVEEVPEASVRVPRGGPVAGGKREEIPPAKPLPAWEDPRNQDYGDGADGDDDDGQIDYKDLETLNHDLLKLRVRQNRVRRAMRNAARDATVAKLRYSRALRRELVQQSGGSAESRKARAELNVEELEADMVLKAQVAEEYLTLFRSVRDDTENVKAVSYNLRALL